MTLEEKVQLLKEAAYSVSECKLYDEDGLTYSGRGMYGKCSPMAVTLGQYGDEYELDEFLQEVSDGEMSLEDVSSDSLGMGAVFYVR